MKEVYVSFEVAKLLKDKGFCEENIYCYYQGEYENDSTDVLRGECKFNWNVYDDSYSAPTQQMACRWLREVHKIDISVTPDDGSWWIKVTELEYWSGVFNGKVLNSDDIKYAYQGDTNTKEDCYEAGLWYVLKNLI